MSEHWRPILGSDFERVYRCKDSKQNAILMNEAEDEVVDEANKDAVERAVPKKRSGRLFITLTLELWAGSCLLGRARRHRKVCAMKAYVLLRNISEKKRKKKKISEEERDENEWDV